MKRLVYVFILVFFSSCFQEDEKVPAYQSPAGVTTSVAEMGPDYGVQIFYDIETATFVKTTQRSSWDLALQCGAGDYHIYLNMSKFMSVASSGSVDFSAVTSDAGLTYHYDKSSGAEDSTAIGEWGTSDGANCVSNNQVYVIDRGLSTSGDGLGKKKIQVLGLTENVYQVRVANLNGSQEQVLSVTKDADKNFVYLSFDGAGSVADVEPNKTEWDLLFTQYTALVEQQGTGIVEDYSVNGVLINPYQVQVARDFSKPFADITYTDLDTYIFSNTWDIIGYDWKWYNFSSMVYEILTGRTYVVYTVEGNYYKLRFTSFTNASGIKGYPTFEVAKF